MTKTCGVSIVRMLMTMNYLGVFGQVCSPIAGFIIAFSGLVELNPYHLIKHNAVQLLSGYVLILTLDHLWVD